MLNMRPVPTQALIATISGIIWGGAGGDGLERRWHEENKNVCKERFLPMIAVICMVFGAWPASSQTIDNFRRQRYCRVFRRWRPPPSMPTLNDPKGMAIDAAGNVYIADPGNARDTQSEPGRNDFDLCGERGGRIFGRRRSGSKRFHQRRLGHRAGCSGRSIYRRLLKPAHP